MSESLGSLKEEHFYNWLEKTSLGGELEEGHLLTQQEENSTFRCDQCEHLSTYNQN